MTRLEDFCVLKSLRVDNIAVEPKRVHARYTTVRPDGSESSTELIYSYEFTVFDPQSPSDRNLASMMVTQVALNYGLFCEELILEGLFDETDRNFLEYML